MNTNQKVSVRIIFVVLAVVIVGIAGYFIFQKIVTVSVKAPLQPSKTISESNIFSNSAVNWRVYQNKKFGFEFKYPEEIVFTSPVSTSQNVFMVESTVAADSSKDKLSIGLFIHQFDGFGEKVLQAEKDSWNSENLESAGLQEIKIGNSPAIKESYVNVVVGDTGGDVNKTANAELDSFKDKYFYSFQCSQGGNNLDLCNQIISTFKFIP